MDKLWTLVLPFTLIIYTFIWSTPLFSKTVGAKITESWNKDLESMKPQLPKLWKNKIKSVSFYSSTGLRDLVKSLRPKINKDTVNGVYELEISIDMWYENQTLQTMFIYHINYVNIKTNKKNRVWELARTVSTSLKTNPLN